MTTCGGCGELNESDATHCVDCNRPLGWGNGMARSAAPAEEQTTTVERGPMLRVREVAAILGVSHYTVYRRIASGELPAVRIGRGPMPPIRIFRGDIDKLLKPNGPQ